MAIEIKVLTDKKLGTWRGLGGAISEATAYNFSKLSPEKQQDFLRAYYGQEGLNYAWGRLSVGSNDFCLKPFEYTKRSDMSDFSIAHDEKWVIPMLRAIQKFRKKEGFKDELLFMCAPFFTGGAATYSNTAEPYATSATVNIKFVDGINRRGMVNQKLLTHSETA